MMKHGRSCGFDIKTDISIMAAHQSHDRPSGQQHLSSSRSYRPSRRTVVALPAASIIVHQHPSSCQQSRRPLASSPHRPTASVVQPLIQQLLSSGNSHPFSSAVPPARSIAQQITILRCRIAWNSPPPPSAPNHTIILPKYEGK